MGVNPPPLPKITALRWLINQILMSSYLEEAICAYAPGPLHRFNLLISVTASLCIVTELVSICLVMTTPRKVTNNATPVIIESMATFAGVLTAWVGLFVATASFTVPNKPITRPEVADK